MHADTIDPDTTAPLGRSPIPDDEPHISIDASGHVVVEAAITAAAAAGVGSSGTSEMLSGSGLATESVSPTFQAAATATVNDGARAGISTRSTPLPGYLPPSPPRSVSGFSQGTLR